MWTTFSSRAAVFRPSTRPTHRSASRPGVSSPASRRADPSRDLLGGGKMKLARTFRVVVITALVAVACAPTATPSAAPTTLAGTAAADLRFTLWSGAEAHLRT